jgi:hypothetical protein
VSEAGDVTEALLVERADPSLDEEILAKVLLWKYSPFTVHGRPMPFCTRFPLTISTYY